MLPFSSWAEDSRLITATSLGWRDLDLHVNDAHGRGLQHTVMNWLQPEKGEVEKNNEMLWTTVTLLFKHC